MLKRERKVHVCGRDDRKRPGRNALPGPWTRLRDPVESGRRAPDQSMRANDDDLYSSVRCGLLSSSSSLLPRSRCESEKERAKKLVTLPTLLASFGISRFRIPVVKHCYSSSTALRTRTERGRYNRVVRVNGKRIKCDAFYATDIDATQCT